MERFTHLLLLLFASFLSSSGKTIHRLKQSDKEVKRKMEADKVDIGNYIDSKGREVRPIEPGYIHQHFSKKSKYEESAASPKERRHCFCGIPRSYSCPDGFIATQVHWNDAPLTGPLMPPNLPTVGPPFGIGDEQAWLQDSYDGELQQDVYGWNWKERLNDNVQAGPQHDASPCMQQGWCCCGDEPTNKESDAVKPDKTPTQQEEKDTDRIIINIA
ncbi:uncharacterized protein LOC111329160 [Stylophora pistillata]|uniref:Uncharacterized protein n=1 Tax=Stylophora pistillata TaxID=50429 RepID=A0A2B4SAC4_STYPI|nr:uncharacterized protein LOC111329160 [Stylophora pistillata]PFX26336.1 hypothetical protein AWC38_SpisGene9020 [Stylophora pistillata]